MPIVQYRRKNVLNSISTDIKDLSMEEALAKAGLDFNVGIIETRVRLENPKFDGINDNRKHLLYSVPDNYATYRTDNNFVFGAVGSKYQVVQNNVALDFINKVCDYDRDVRIETAGSFKNGASMLVTAKFPSSMSIGKNDDIDRYLLFTNSHDGSSAIECAVTNVRVICNNMLNMALRNAEQRFSFKHTKNVQFAINQAVESIRKSHVYSEIMKDQLEALAKVHIKEENVKGYVYSLFLNEEQKAYAKTAANIQSCDSEIISTRLKNKITTILDTIESGAGQNLHRGSLLWLYNGVTCYTNNVANYKTEEDRFLSLTKREGFKLNQKAYDLAMSAIKVA